MKKYLSVLLFLILFPNLYLQKTSADVASQSGAVNIKVTINGFALSLSGYLAPYASITLTSGGNVFASTTADADGNFSFNSVRVAKGFNSFCLDGVDYKRLGESEACLTIPAVIGPYSKSEIFLPPTVGVFRENVNVGNDALVFGYGMPNALISVKLDNKVACEKTADKDGYYECSFAIEKEGNHEVYADAQLNGKPSEPQLKRVLIKGLAVIKTKSSTPLFNLGNLPSVLFGLPGILIALFLLLLLIIALIVWLRKHNPAWLPRLYLPNPADALHHGFDSIFKQRKLHHWWMKGIGY